MLLEKNVRNIPFKGILFLIIIVFELTGFDLQQVNAQVNKIKKAIDVKHYTITVSNRKGNSQDTVYYSKQHQLTWDDFRGTPRAESAYSAAAFTGFGYNGEVKYRGDTAIINIVMDVYFIQSYSWVRVDAKSDYALAHEQLHFDITYLITERLKKDYVK